MGIDTSPPDWNFSAPSPVACPCPSPVSSSTLVPHLNPSLFTYPFSLQSSDFSLQFQTSCPANPSLISLSPPHPSVCFPNQSQDPACILIPHSICICHLCCLAVTLPVSLPDFKSQSAAQPVPVSSPQFPVPVSLSSPCLSQFLPPLKFLVPIYSHSPPYRYSSCPFCIR